MTKAEMTTIADALSAKRSWVRKTFDEMMITWSKITDGMEFDQAFLGKYAVDDEHIHSVFLIPGKADLHFQEEDKMDYYVDGGTSNCGHRDHLSVHLIRWTAPKIAPGITKRFKQIQNDIDAMSAAGQEMRRVVECLNK